MKVLRKAISTLPNIDVIEREIKRRFDTFNLQVVDSLGPMLTRSTVDFGAIQNGYRSLADNFAAEMVNVMILGGRLSATQAAAQTGIPMAFDPTNATALASLIAFKSEVMSLLLQQQAEALAEIRQAVADVTAIRSVNEVKVGLTLTARQNRAVSNYRRLLEAGSTEALARQLRDRRFDPTVRRAAAGTTTLSAEQIDRMVERYASRQMDYRAKTIAATEAVRIASESNALFFQQATERGDLQPEQLEHKWVTSKDERVRSSHRAMNGVVKAPGELWTSGDGNTLRYPGDPRAPASDTINCRCWIATKIVENAQSEAA